MRERLIMNSSIKQRGENSDSPDTMKITIAAHLPDGKIESQFNPEDSTKVNTTQKSYSKVQGTWCNFFQNPKAL